jgi:hypothetical protein
MLPLLDNLIKMKKSKVPLSASRIKCLDTCSWDYYCSYILKLPDSDNTGSAMGSACHNIYEFLGEKRRKHYYDKLIKNQNIECVPAIERYARLYLLKRGFDPEQWTISAHGEDVQLIDLIERMLLEGLNYDFFCKNSEEGEPYKSISEKDFDIEVEEGDLSYRVRGFIDKLFLFKESCSAVIRDFKSSKRKFEGKDVDDNIQDLIYRLAVKKLYPEYIKRHMEFVFLQFDCESQSEKKGGILLTPDVDDSELDGLEHFLTDIQKVVDNFDEELALSNMAAKKGFLGKYHGFSGILKCGIKNVGGKLVPVESPNEKKPNGDTRWFCPQKFPFYYYVALDKKGKVIASTKKRKDLPNLEKNQKIEKRWYSGCPSFSNLKYNREKNKQAQEKGFEVRKDSNKPVDSEEELW